MTTFDRDGRGNWRLSFLFESGKNHPGPAPKRCSWVKIVWLGHRTAPAIVRQIGLLSFGTGGLSVGNQVTANNYPQYWRESCHLRKKPMK